MLNEHSELEVESERIFKTKLNNCQFRPESKPIKSSSMLSIKNKFKKFNSKFKEGDEETFSKIYKKFRKPILSYIFLKLRNHDVAEEIVQEVFLKVFRFRESFDPEFEFSTWLWTIARNTLADWFRKNKKATVLEEEFTRISLESELESSVSLNPERTLIQTNESQLLVYRMSRLTDLQRKALLMRLVHRFSYEEIAQQLNLSLSAVKSVLHRAKASLTSRISTPEFK